ncbi:MAG: glycosyltransferase family 2 protein [Candidatus Omnitrophica bacterium]|nr:glycosyltransferase family 2 protein [Candidatus Omnitrophota bacterium]MBU4488358.1 glycosyltransferase family 2 protein [Candidatus Omnitrophota bacterium]MCG2704868.1 glycosyltransferase family 2 protein [Candidatus Omnitrophota bacterium]
MGTLIAKIVFWFLMALTVFIYFLYPLVLAFIAKIMGREPVKADITPFVSLIVPMHNEEKVAKEKVENILALDYPKDKLEVIFALDGCTDRTKEIISWYNNTAVKILETNERGGKVAVLNHAVPSAKGEIIVFSDANSMHEQDTLRKIVRNFADEKVGCVSGILKYKEADATSVGKGENLYWKYEHFMKVNESRLGKLLVTNGSIQAVRKALYPYPSPDVADDFSIPLIIQSKRYKVLYEPEAIVYERATQSLKEEFDQKVRIISQGMKGVVLLWRDLLRLSPMGIFELLFHKVIRWYVPFCMILVFLLNILLLGEPIYRFLFILQIAFYICAFMGFLFRHKTKTKIFYIPFYFCLINFASLVAVYKFFKGEQTRTWDKAHSTRIEIASPLRGSQ